MKKTITLLLTTLVMVVACTIPPKVTLPATSAGVATEISFSTQNPDTTADFILHQNIIEDLPTFSITLLGKNLLAGLTRTHLDSKMVELKSFSLSGHICTQVRVRVYSNQPIADFWVLTTFGHTQDSNHTYNREPIDVNIDNGTIDLRVVVDDPPQGATVAHGQGLPVKFFRYSFAIDGFVDPPIAQYIPKQTIESMSPWFTIPASPKWIKNQYLAWDRERRPDNKDYTFFDKSTWVPSYPGQTGDQRVFGLFNVLPEVHSGVISLPVWRKQLYQEACRPGKFIHTNGVLVTQDHYPGLVIGTWAHEHSKGYDSEYWITHTDRKAPWKDKPNRDESGRVWTHWDDQHWALGPLCQVYRLTGDAGLRMLIDHTIENWMFSNPVVNKGTSHHNGSTARAKGRLIEAGAELYWCLNSHDTVLKERLFAHLETMIKIQISEWDTQVRNTGRGIKGRRDGFSPWEHGLWCKGLMAAEPLMTDPVVKAKMKEMMFGISLWLLTDCFFDDFEGYEGQWYTPYLLFYQGGHSDSPSKGLTTWCTSAMQALHKYGRKLLSPADLAKLDAIIKQRITDNIGVNDTWDNLSRWRLY